MFQHSYSGQLRPGIPGDLADVGDKKVTRATNDDPRAQKVVAVTVDTAANETEYSVKIKGQKVAFESDADATKVEIAAGLAAAINAEPLVNGTVVAESDGVDTVTITARIGGYGYEFEEADANLSSTTTQANAEAAAVKFGRALVLGGQSDKGNILAVLAQASKLTAHSVELTPDVANTTLYRIYVTVDGATKEVEYTSDADATAQEIVEGLKAAFDAAVDTDKLQAVEDDATLTISAVTAGQMFGVDYNDGLSKTAETQGDDINEVFHGVALYSPEQEGADDGYADQYPGGSTMSVLRRGPFNCVPEDAPSVGNPVYVRLAANGAADQIGGFRGSFDKGCVKLDALAFREKISDTMFVVEVE